ncbi:MAG: pimeloyl-ACP methyl ester carboxylesterase [Paracoccaceae bacterium]|jgi:pimeloyl-ACP methyl ester carboxylesterase
MHLTLRSVGGLPMRLMSPPGRPHGWALTLHGRGGAWDRPHMAAIGAAWLRRGWAVAAPSLRHSGANDAPGDPAGFTMAGHLRDAAAALDALIAEGRGPVALCGHSIGAWAAAMLAPDAPLLAVSPVLSGSALLRARHAMGGDAMAVLAQEVPSAATEWPGHDAASALAARSGPVAVVSGHSDGIVPPDDARAFFAAARDGRFLSLIPGQHHCPAGPPFDAALDAALDALGV